MAYLSDLKDSDRKVLLNAPITSSGLFGDAVESIIERFAEAQKHAKAISHVMPRRSFQPPSRSRSSSATRPPQRREVRPAAVTVAEAPRREPDMRRKVWPGPGKRRQVQRRSPRRDTGPPPSRLPEGVVRREERTGGPAPKRSRMSRKVLESDIHNVCVLTCCSIKTHTSSQKELFSPHSVSVMQLAPPQSSAEPPPTQRIITHHLPAHPLTKLLKLLYQSLKAWKVILGISRWLLGVIKHGYTLQFRCRPPHFKGVVQSLTFASKRAVSETRGMQSARKRSDRKSPISDPSTEHLASIHSGC